MKRIKSKIKSATRLPGNAAVMSMMAVILVFGAPALVSVLHEDMSEDMFIKTEITPPEEGIDVVIKWEETAPEDTIKTFSMVPTDDGVTIVLDDPNASQYLRTINFKLFDETTVGDISKIIVNTSIPDSKVHFTGFYNGNYTSFGPLDNLLDADGNKTGVFDFEPTAIDSVKLQSGKFTQFGFDMILVHIDPAERPGFFDITVEQYNTYTIPISEIVIGATGVLLLICALMATPWFSTSGLTIRRRR